VRWANPHGHICVGLDPTAENAKAGKHEGVVDPIEVDHGQFQVAIKWCGFDAEPIHSDAFIKRRFAYGLDCRQYPVLLQGQIRTLLAPFLANTLGLAISLLRASRRN
jgi:hypothetical protein